MPAIVSTTRWRDRPIVPDGYEDIARLVKVARQARDRIVEFDWVFTREDLLRMRRAVYEWGSRVVGRYKCFDSRVLAAINAAISETDSIFVLNEPKNSSVTDCTASCFADADMFRLRGHAPFDVVFGYGSAGIGESLSDSLHLGATAQATLAHAVAMLGWDLGRLQEERFRPVRNALYGLSPGYGTTKVPLPSGPAMDVPVHFHGPFSAFDDGGYRCLFNDKMAAGRGVYLWTINVKGVDRPWYVGQTRRGFGQRMGEHVVGYLSGAYTTYDAVALSRGEYRRAAGAGDEGRWPQALPSFLRNCERLMPNIIALIRLIKFHVAPLEGDEYLHNQVEGAIGRYFKTHSNPELRDFFLPGLKLPAAIPYDKPMRLLLSSEAQIAGLPAELREQASSSQGDLVPVPFPDDVRQFIESTVWTFAKTFAATWPHEYIVRAPENAPMLLALARHVFEHGTEGRFYSHVRKYHHEGGKVYWSMDPTPEATDLVNRCDEAQTYEARLAAGTLPPGSSDDLEI